MMFITGNLKLETKKKLIGIFLSADLLHEQLDRIYRYWQFHRILDMHEVEHHLCLTFF
jgi:hypothetical protein